MFLEIVALISIVLILTITVSGFFSITKGSSKKERIVAGLIGITPIVIILFIYSIVWCAFAVDGVDNPGAVDGVSSPGAVDSVSSGVSCTTTNITFWINAEGTWSSPTYTLHGTNEYTDGDTTGTLTGQLDVTTGSKYLGTYGFDVPSGTDYLSFDWTNGDIFDGNDISVHFWIYVTTWTDNAKVFEFLEAATEYFRVELENTSNEFRIEWRGASDGAQLDCETTGSSLSTGTYYYVEARVDPATNTMNILVDGTDYTSCSNTLTAITPDVSGDDFYFGNQSAQGSDFYLDNFVVTDTHTDAFWGNCSDVNNYP